MTRSVTPEAHHAPRSPSAPRPRARRVPERQSALGVTVFVGSLIAHTSLVYALHVASTGHKAKRVTPTIDIELAPPPPPPPPPPEPEKPPEPPPPPPVAKPLPKAAPPKPAPPKEAPPPPPPIATSDLPSSDDGELTKGPAMANPTIGTPPPPPPPPAPPAPPAPAKVVEAKEGANYLKNPRPKYPRLAMREGWEGQVILRVKVLPDGKVGGATVQKSAGRDVLDEAALDIVKSWTFVPATQGGRPIAGYVAVPFDFRLN